MKNLKELEQKYLELGKEIEALKKQNTGKEEITYPIYCKSIGSSLVVEFTRLNEGKVVVNSRYDSIGEYRTNWHDYNSNDVWQQLDVCKETGFFDGRFVWCWSHNDTHSRYLRFYDVKNKCTFYYDGNRGGTRFNNYEPFEGNYPDWALEAFKTLKR